MSLKNFTFIFLLGIFAFMGKSYGQLPIVGFCANDVSGEQGDVVCIEITSTNFTNVQSFQFNLSYNGTLVIPDCPPAFVHPSLTNSVLGQIVNCANRENGYINFVWADSPVTIPDGEVLFTICFTLIGEPGTLSPVYFNGLVLEVEINQVDANGNTVITNVIDSKPGTITIISNTLRGIAGHCDDSGAGDGSLWFYAVGGSAPYTYTVNPGGITGVLNFDGERAELSGLAANLYTIDITDSNGLPLTITRRINTGTSLTIDRDTIIQPTCFSASNGQIQIGNISGGTGPFVFEWSNFVNGLDTLRRLRPGDYTVTITDVTTKCQIQETYSLAADTIRFNAIIQDTASCQSSRNGTVLISNITGGSPFTGTQPYSARINSGATFRRIMIPHTSANNLGVGDIRIEIQDALGCTVDTVIQMPYLYDVTIDTVLFQNITCHGANDGSLRIRALVGNPNIRFGYIPSTNLINSGNLGGVFISENLPPDTYSVLARDFNTGCEANFIFEITEPEPLLINALVLDADCVDLGSIDVNPLGGTGSYTYSWNPDQGNVSMIENITGGTYSLTVTDENNCTKDTVIMLNMAGTLNISISTVDVTCDGRTDGTASVNVQFSGGNIQPFTVFWRDENGNRIQGSTTTIGNLMAGNYTVEVVTNDGCSSQPRPFIINEGASVDFVSSIDSIPCFGGEGTIGINITGDPAGYIYEWREVGNVTTINTSNSLDAQAGQYTVTVVSPEGCQRVESFILNQPERLVDITVDFRTIECFGRETGAAVVTNIDNNMVYTWANGSVGQNILFVPAGNYWVVGNLEGCITDTTFFTITQFPPLVLDSSQLALNNPTCFGEDNGSIQVGAEGGTRQGYRYTWSVPGEVSNSISNLSAGTYTVTLSDSNNCIEEYTFVLTEPLELVASLDPNRSQFLDCNNQDNASLAITTTGGNPGIKTISWQSGLTVNNGVATGLSPGNYCATITDNFGCLDTFCYDLMAPPPLEGAMAVPAEPLCFGGTTCLEVDFITGGTGNRYTFQINNGIRYPIDSCVTVFAGTYFINLIDSSGCSISTTVTIGQPDPIVVVLGSGPTINLGEPSAVVSGTVIVPSGNSFNTTWSPDEVECLNVDCTTISVAPTETTLYTLLVTDTNGCTASDQTTVTVKKSRNVYFANIFSPNQDGVNDFFQPVTGIGVESVLQFYIYDRWGNMVFERTNYVPDPAGPGGWDGTFNGRKLDAAVYVYYCKVRFLDNREIEYSGSVTMLGSDR